MDKRTVRRIVATALAVILAEQVFFLICGFGLPVQSEEAEWLLTVTVP